MQSQGKGTLLVALIVRRKIRASWQVCLGRTRDFTRRMHAQPVSNRPERHMIGVLSLIPCTDRRRG